MIKKLWVPVIFFCASGLFSQEVTNNKEPDKPYELIIKSYSVKYSPYEYNRSKSYISNYNFLTGYYYFNDDFKIVRNTDITTPFLFSYTNQNRWKFQFSYNTIHITNAMYSNITYNQTGTVLYYESNITPVIRTDASLHALKIIDINSSFEIQMGPGLRVIRRNKSYNNTYRNYYIENEGLGPSAYLKFLWKISPVWQLYAFFDFYYAEGPSRSRDRYIGLNNASETVSLSDVKVSSGMKTIFNGIEHELGASYRFNDIFSILFGLSVNTALMSYKDRTQSNYTISNNAFYNRFTHSSVYGPRFHPNFDSYSGYFIGGSARF